MTTFLRNLTAWTALVSLTTVSLVGQGLHLLPGCCHEHHAVAGGTSNCPDRCGGPVQGGEGCPGHRFESPANNGASLADSFSGDRFSGDRGFSSDEGTCPICRFLAQAKAPVTIAKSPPKALPVLDNPAPVPLLHDPLFSRLFDARGPPLAV